VVVPCYSFDVCNLVPIHYCYTILPHGYTHSFRHPKFYKIVHLSSHVLLSVNLVLINSCIPLGGALCINLENKTLLCLIDEKSMCYHQSPKRGRVKVHLGPVWVLED
jgi:hypothetical protein